jgi:antitoxin ParD1/3/4
MFPLLPSSNKRSKRGVDAGLIAAAMRLILTAIVISNDTAVSEIAMPSSYTLGTRFEAFVRGLVESGRYDNASEVVRDGLRLLEDREKLREIRVAELRRLAEEGRLSGLSEDDGETVLDRLEARYRGMSDQPPTP